jgi:SAM-dependent methyltransferase
MSDDLRALIENDPLAAAERPGPVGRLVRRLVVSSLGPYFQHQREVDWALLGRIEALEQEIAAIYERLEHYVEPRQIEDRLEALDRTDLETIQALELLRERVSHEEDRDRRLIDRADVLEELADASRVLPYMEGRPLHRYEVAQVGEVIGYRDWTPSSASPYEAFASVFRGSEERVAELQRPYVELLAGHEPVLDLGSGRGEFLDLLREAGIEALGVDADPGMVERCRAKGHDVTQADAVSFLEEQDDGSLGAVFSAQLIEHLKRRALERLIEVAHAKLAPGGLFVAETVNPHCALALKAFWIDLTHQHPIFPEVALTICRIVGFPEAYVFHPAGGGNPEEDRFTQEAYAVVATKAA